MSEAPRQTDQAYQHSSPSAPTSTLCGVDIKLIERFLVLIRDNYPKADRASFFLEEVAGKTYTFAMANLRDVLSHLATTLSDETDPKDWDAQLASAEEHFRRAIQEPYAIALGTLRETFNTVHDEYQKIEHSIEILQKQGFFATAPSEQIIQSQLRAIATLASEGRTAKRRNRIDAKWDDGVKSYIEAFDKLDLLTRQLSGHIHQHLTLSTAARHTKLHRVGIALAIIFGVLAALLVLDPSLTTAIQKFFGIS